MRPMSNNHTVSIFLICAVVLAGFAMGALGRYEHTPQETASAQSRKSELNKPGKTGKSCIFDYERGEISHCIHRTSLGELFVASQVLKDLDFDSYGLAPVLSLKGGWMYVNRTGKVLITGVPVMDNWADTFHDGLVRVVRNNKYDFSNSRGQLVISPIYDGAMNFEKGKAKVCNGCKTKCVDQECEYHVFSGGEWFQIDTKGTPVGRIPSEK